jgi:hypothetical protein
MLLLFLPFSFLFFLFFVEKKTFFFCFFCFERLTSGSVGVNVAVGMTHGGAPTRRATTRGVMTLFLMMLLKRTLCIIKH